MGRVAMALLVLGVTAATAHADMIDMTGVEPWDVCGECHGVDGAGNRIKFPRIAGQPVNYILKQLDDFRHKRRGNDGGQMQVAADELPEAELQRVAKWFAAQAPDWPEPTLAAPTDSARARMIATEGADGIPACLGCHSASSPQLYDRPFAAPRLAGQRDYYIAKQLADFRAGRRDNDPGQMMTRIARKLGDADIAALAVFLSQNPDLHGTSP